tara:strand:+ start:231 stop:545 length:315 start_codon:yes stop_codon:yes gene_type:complete
MSYYENNKDQFADDCIKLNSVLGHAMDEFEESFKGDHKDSFITEAIPVVLAKLLARHFKHFYYDEPGDILNYLNYIKSIFVAVCDDKEELEMVKEVDYSGEIQA